MSAEISLHPQEVRAPEVRDSGEILRMQSPEVQKIVQDDPRLGDHLREIANLEEFFRLLEAEKHIFLQKDNTLAQEIFLGQSIKGLGYGQMTSDGRDFSDLTEKDVKGLLDTDYDKYQEWKISQKKAKVITEEQRLKENSAKVITEEQRLKENGVKADTVKNLADESNVQAEILQKKNKEAGELIKKLGLSSEGEKELDIRLKKAKENENNPVAQDLISKGIDPKSSDYDNLLRASIVLSDTATFREFSTNKKDFDESLARLNMMGIPRDISLKIADITTHIDARFPKSSATETAKSEIARSISTGNISSISYDGKGEKYTLMNRDGQTSKEVYMSPPRVRVVRSGLIIEQEVPEKTGEEKRIDTESKLGTAREKSGESIRVFMKDMGDRAVMNDEHVELVSAESYKSNYVTLMGRQPLEKRRESAEKLRTLYREARDGRTPNKDIYDRKYIELSDTLQRLERESEAEKNYRNLPARTALPMERFDTIASTNLSWLTENRFDRMGPGANEALSRIIEEVNLSRTPANRISLEGNILDTSEKDTLLSALRKIGGTPDTLTDADKLASFQKNIQQKLQIPASKNGSIANTLRRD